MKKYLFAVLLILLAAAPLRAQTGGEDPDVESLKDMQLVICDYEHGGYLEQLLSMLEFYIRMEYTTPEENEGLTLDQVIEKMKQETRAEFTADAGPRLGQCKFTDLYVITCDALIDEELKNAADKSDKDRSIAEGMAEKARAVIKDMGFKMCAHVKVQATTDGNDVYEGDLMFGMRGGRGGPWSLLAEMWAASPANSNVPEFNAPAQGGATLESSCIYDIIPGRIAVSEVRPADPAAYNCGTEPVEVIFSFTPDDPNAPASYGFPGWEDAEQFLTTTDGRNPNREWVESAGLKPGADFAAARLELSGGEGDCTPVQFQFLDIDKTGADRTCLKDNNKE